MGEVRIGISGWQYDGWRGVFYPEGLPRRRELEFASRTLPTIEINGSFYSLQRPETYDVWYRATPPEFVFAIKGGRYITHVRQLEDAEQPLANFFASGLFNLREKLGPVLWQLPPGLRYEPETLEAFLSLLPHDAAEAMELARRHDEWMDDRSQIVADDSRPLRHALEVRNASFLEPSFIGLLRKYRVALVIADSARKVPCREDLTADFVYMRLHGHVEMYASGYTDVDLERWADRIRIWSAGGEPDDARRISPRDPEALPARDIYCYFDNDMKVRAPFDAQALMGKLGVASPVA